MHIAKELTDMGLQKVCESRNGDRCSHHTQLTASNHQAR
jgi:hypothetical protein